MRNNRFWKKSLSNEITPGKKFPNENMIRDNTIPNNKIEFFFIYYFLNNRHNTTPIDISGVKIIQNPALLGFEATNHKKQCKHLK
jgi:hypothetical protein